MQNTHGILDKNKIKESKTKKAKNRIKIKYRLARPPLEMIHRTNLQFFFSIHQMKELQIDDFNPWGKPGHGAPNEDSLRKRKIFMDVLPPVVLKV